MFVYVIVVGALINRIILYLIVVENMNEQGGVYKLLITKNKLFRVVRVDRFAY